MLTTVHTIHHAMRLICSLIFNKHRKDSNRVHAVINTLINVPSAWHSSASHRKYFLFP